MVLERLVMVLEQSHTPIEVKTRWPFDFSVAIVGTNNIEWHINTFISKNLAHWTWDIFEIQNNDRPKNMCLFCALKVYELVEWMTSSIRTTKDIIVVYVSKNVLLCLVRFLWKTCFIRRFSRDVGNRKFRVDFPAYPLSVVGRPLKGRETREKSCGSYDETHHKRNRGFLVFRLRWR